MRILIAVIIVLSLALVFSVNLNVNQRAQLATYPLPPCKDEPAAERTLAPANSIPADAEFLRVWRTEFLPLRSCLRQRESHAGLRKMRDEYIGVSNRLSQLLPRDANGRVTANWDERSETMIPLVPPVAVPAPK